MDVLTTNVGGVYFWVWILVFPALFVVYFLFMNWRDQRELYKKAEGKIFCLFHTLGQEAYWKWCWEDKGELTPADMKGYDKKAKMLAAKAIGKIKSEQQEFGYYFVLPDHVFQIGYPFEKPKINIRITEYVENYPAPRVTADLLKWDSDEYAKVTSAMAEASKDTTDLRAIISEAAGIEERLLGLADVPKDIQLIKYLCIGSCGIGVIVGLLVAQVISSLGKLMQYNGITMLEHVIKVFSGG